MKKELSIMILIEISYRFKRAAKRFCFTRMLPAKNNTFLSSARYTVSLKYI